MIWIHLSQTTYMEPLLFCSGTLCLFLPLHLVRRKKVYFPRFTFLHNPSVVWQSIHTRPAFGLSSSSLGMGGSVTHLDPVVGFR